MTLLRYFSISLSAVSLVVYNVFAKNISNMLSIRQTPSSISPQTFNIMYESGLACSLVSNLMQLILGSDETFNTNLLNNGINQQKMVSQEDQEMKKSKGFLAQKLPLIANLSIMITHAIMCVWSWTMSSRQASIVISLVLTVGMIVFNAVPIIVACFSHPSESPKRLSSLTLFVRRMFFRMLIVSPLCVFESILICTLPIIINSVSVENTGTNNCTVLPIVISIVSSICVFIGTIEREFSSTLVAFVFSSANATLQRSITLSCGDELSSTSFAIMILTAAISVVLAIRSLMDMNRYTNYYRTTKDIQQDLQKATESLNLNATIELFNSSINSQLASKVKTPSGGLIKTIRDYKEKRMNKKLMKKMQNNSEGEDNDVVQEENDEDKYLSHHRYDNGMSISDEFFEGHKSGKEEEDGTNSNNSDNKKANNDGSVENNGISKENVEEFIDSSGFVITNDTTFRDKKLIYKKPDNNSKDDVGIVDDPKLDDKRVITHHSDSTDGEDYDKDEENIEEESPEDECEDPLGFGRKTIIMMKNEDNNNGDNDNDSVKKNGEIKRNCVKPNLDPVIRSTLSPTFDVNLINGGIDPSMTLSSILKTNDSTSFEYKVNTTMNINRTLSPPTHMDSIMEDEGD